MKFSKGFAVSECVKVDFSESWVIMGFRQSFHSGIEVCLSSGSSSFRENHLAIFFSSFFETVEELNQSFCDRY